MRILAYGEDALTLWAIRNKLALILQMLRDPSDPAQCRAFFRPSFGRSGGKRSSQFGEFDFILLAEHCIYLGESKWDKSSEKIRGGVLDLRDEQLLRHKMFKFYVEEWAFGDYTDWREFADEVKSKLPQRGIVKPVAPENSLPASNLRTASDVIKQHYTTLPAIRNVLVYFYDGRGNGQLPRKAGKDFAVVPVDYSEVLLGNFIELGA
jgi:hypothetical protein